MSDISKPVESLKTFLEETEPVNQVFTKDGKFYIEVNVTPEEVHHFVDVVRKTWRKLKNKKKK